MTLIQLDFLKNIFFVHRPDCKLFLQHNLKQRLITALETIIVLNIKSVA